MKTGGGGGLNSLSGTLALNAPTTLTFKFDAAPYLEAQTTGNNLATDWARADLNFSITVTDAQGTVFNWTPDGQANNAPLALDIVDSAALNHDLFANPLNPAPPVHGCPGQGQMGPGPMHGNVLACAFQASSLAVLPAGFYNLSVSMEEHAHASIPEPGSVLLLGSGLLGLAMGRRKLARAA